MSERREVLPVDFFPNTTSPRDPILFEAVQKFCEAEFGSRAKLQTMGKVWASVKISEEGEGYEVVGLTAVAQAVDCPIFHVRAGGDDPASREQARAVRDELMRRAANFIQDNIGAGTDVLVFVSESQERFWKGYLKLIGAKSANRFIVRV